MWFASLIEAAIVLLVHIESLYYLSFGMCISNQKYKTKIYLDSDAYFACMYRLQFINEFLYYSQMKQSR